MGQRQLALRPVDDRLGGSGVGVDELEMDEAAAAEMHAPLGLAFPPHRNRNVADAHRLGDARAPAPLQFGAHRRLAAAWLARDHHPPHARTRQVDAARPRPLQKVRRVGRRQRGHRRLQRLDGRHQALGIPGADGNMAKAQTLESFQRRAGDERARIVARDQPFAARHPRGRVAARRGPHPRVEVARRQRNVARRPRRAAGGIDPHDLVGARGAMRADRFVGGAAAAQFVLFGEGKAPEVGEAAHRLGVGKAGLRQFLPIEARALEEIADLGPIERLVLDALPVPGGGFDFGVDEAHGAAPGSGAPECWIAASACEAM